MQSVSFCIPSSKRCASFQVPKHQWLNLEMLFTVDNWLRNDNELTSSKLKAMLVEWSKSFPDVALSTTIKSLENHCTSVMLSCGF